MSRSTGKIVFGIVYVVVFTMAIYLINGWKLNDALFASVPVVLCAETVVLGMLFATIFYSEEDEEHSTALAVRQHKPGETSADGERVPSYSSAH